MTSVRKHYCALRLGLVFELGRGLAEIQTCFLASVVEP